MRHALALALAFIWQPAMASAWPVYHDNGSITVVDESYTLIHNGKCIGPRCDAHQPAKKAETATKDVDVSNMPLSPANCRAIAHKVFLRPDNLGFRSCIRGCVVAAAASTGTKTAYYATGQTCKP